jgi:hypothetical protein
MKIVNVTQLGDFNLEFTFDNDDICIVEIFHDGDVYHLTSLFIKNPSRLMAIKILRYMKENYEPLIIDYQIDKDVDFVNFLNNPNEYLVNDTRDDELEILKPLDMVFDVSINNIEIGYVVVEAYYTGNLHIYRMLSEPAKLGLESQVLKYVKDKLSISLEVNDEYKEFLE